MYKVSWQVISFPNNANEERIFVTITNRSSQVKFIMIVVVSSCTRTIGNLKEIWKREIRYQNLSYNIEPEIEILTASLVFAISISYSDVRNSFRHVSALKRVAKLFVGPCWSHNILNQVRAPNRSQVLKCRPDQ